MSRPAAEAEGIRPPCALWSAASHFTFSATLWCASTRMVERLWRLASGGALLLALIATGAPPRLFGQGVSVRYPDPAPSALLLTVAGVLQQSDTSSSTLNVNVAWRSNDYRWELGIAGAALFGIAGLVAANAACSPDTTSDSCVGPVVGTAAVGSLIGGVIGLFIGAGIEKPAELPSAPTSAVHRGRVFGMRPNTCLQLPGRPWPSTRHSID